MNDEKDDTKISHEINMHNDNQPWPRYNNTEN